MASRSRIEQTYGNGTNIRTTGGGIDELLCVTLLRCHSDGRSDRSAIRTQRALRCRQDADKLAVKNSHDRQQISQRLPQHYSVSESYRRRRQFVSATSAFLANCRRVTMTEAAVHPRRRRGSFNLLQPKSPPRAVDHTVRQNFTFSIHWR